MSGDQGADLLGSNFGGPGDFDLNNYINSDYFPEYDPDDVKFDFDNQTSESIGNVGAGASFNTDSAFDTTSQQQLDSTGSAMDHSNAHVTETAHFSDNTSVVGSSKAGTPQHEDPALRGGNINNSADSGDNGSATGKVLGSIGSSSGMHSPPVEDSNDADNNISSQRAEATSKRRSQRLRKTQ